MLNVWLSARKLYYQSLFLDASLTGMGAAWGDRVYATPIHNCPDLKLTIIHFEMLNIVIALRIWGHLWQHGSISIRCDNLGVVQVIKSGKTRDQFLALCVRNIWLLTASHDIDLVISQELRMSLQILYLGCILINQSIVTF